MRLLFFIAVITFSSCGQNSGKTNQPKTDSVPATLDTTKTNKIPDTTVVNSQQSELFTKANALLTAKFPGKWKIINDSIDKWPADEFDYFIKDKRKQYPDYPYLATGDYNADGKSDIAALVVNTANNDEHRIAILLDITKIIIWNDDVRGAAINTNPKEAVGGIDGKVAKMKSEGINVEFFEKSSWVLYWNGSAFKKIWTGD